MSEATEFQRKMEDNVCFPNSRTYNTVIRGFIRSSDLQNALYYRNFMVNEGFGTEVETMSLFVNLLSSDQLSVFLKELLQKSFFVSGKMYVEV